jgi:hypothetical protein
MIIASELPAAQPGLLTISWMTEDKLGVLWSRPAAPTVSQAAGTQDTPATVLDRDDMFRVAVENPAALSMA